MAKLKWSDADEIGFILSEKFPEVDPLTVRFTDLHKRVRELDDFDDPGESTESLLEAVQMAWLEYYRQDG